MDRPFRSIPSLQGSMPGSCGRWCGIPTQHKCCWNLWNLHESVGLVRIYCHRSKCDSSNLPPVASRFAGEMYMSSFHEDSVRVSMMVKSYAHLNRMVIFLMQVSSSNKTRLGKPWETFKHIRTCQGFFFVFFHDLEVPYKQPRHVQSKG